MKRIITKIFVLFVVASSFSLVSCNKGNEPFKAFISADKYIVQPGESVTFTNSSINAEHVIWELDSARANNNNTISRTFAKPGIYKVKLRAYSSNRDIDMAEYTVFVGKLRIKNFFTTRLNYFNPDYTPTDTVNENPFVHLSINDTITYGHDNVSPAKLPIYFLNFDPSSNRYIDINQNKVWNLVYEEFKYYHNSSNLAYLFKKKWSADFYKLANQGKNLRFSENLDIRAPFILSISDPDDYPNLFASMELDISQ